MVLVVLKYQSTHALEIILMQKKLKRLLAKISEAAKHKDADKKKFCFFCSFGFLFFFFNRTRLPFMSYLKKNTKW